MWPAVRALLERDADKRDDRRQTPVAGGAFKGLVVVAEALVEGWPICKNPV